MQCSIALDCRAGRAAESWDRQLYRDHEEMADSSVALKFRSIDIDMQVMRAILSRHFG